MPSGQAATEGGIRPGEQAASPAIALRDIHKSFGPVHANRGVSLEVEKGSITGIIGENGAGKSTLMSILYGLYEADSGESWSMAGRWRCARRAMRSPPASAWSISISC